MSKKIAILLLAFMLTSCANSTSSDSQAETEAVSETTTTTVTTQMTATYNYHNTDYCNICKRKRIRDYHIKGNIGITVYYSRQHNNYHHNKIKSEYHRIRQSS